MIGEREETRTQRYLLWLVDDSNLFMSSVRRRGSTGLVQIKYRSGPEATPHQPRYPPPYPVPGPLQRAMPFNN